MHRVLIVEDDSRARALFAALVGSQQHGCDAVDDGAKAMAKLRREQYCAILLDLLLPGTNGFEVLQFIKSERPSMLKRVIVLTGADTSTIEHFDPSHVWTMLRKPIDISELGAIVEACAEQEEHSH